MPFKCWYTFEEPGESVKSTVLGIFNSELEALNTARRKLHTELAFSRSNGIAQIYISQPDKDGIITKVYIMPTK